jgi:hypothetical protein
MNVPVNYLAIVIAAAANFVLGFMWYGPLFGRPWRAMMGISNSNMNKPDGMWKMFSIQLIGALLMAYVLWHSLVFAATYTNTTGMAAGLMVGFWSWLGFVAPVSVGSVLWENKPWKLWFINTGYYLAALLIMGVILASFLG